MKVLSVWTVTASVCLGLTVEATYGITLDDLRRGLQDRESALKRFAVEVDHKTRKRRSSGRYADLNARNVCVLDGNRARCESESDVMAGGDQRPTIIRKRRLAVFDGNEMRSIGGPAKKGWIDGRVAGRMEAFPWERGPRGFLTHVSGEPLSQKLTRCPARIVGESQWDGRPVVVVETGPFEEKESASKGRYLIDVGRGFALVKQSYLIRYHASRQWIEYHSIELHDFTEVSPGVWLPKSGLRQFYQVTEELAAKNAPELWSRGTARFAKWDLNPDVADSRFRLDFPAKLVITDARNGGGFISADINDQVLVDQAGMLNGQVPAGQGQWGASRMVFLAGTITSLIALLVVFWSRRRMGQDAGK